jgi:uncharacterized protein with GYD domain
MATYIVLGQFTDQGIRNVADTSKRADAAKALVKKVGAKVRDLFWTIGRYDVALILEAPDDETMMVFGLSAGKLGNVPYRNFACFLTSRDRSDSEAGRVALSDCAR